MTAAVPAPAASPELASSSSAATPRGRPRSGCARSPRVPGSARRAASARVAAGPPAGPRSHQAIVVGTVTRSGCSKTCARISRFAAVVAGGVEPVADQSRGLGAGEPLGVGDRRLQQGVRTARPRAISGARSGAGAGRAGAVGARAGRAVVARGRPGRCAAPRPRARPSRSRARPRRRASCRRGAGARRRGDRRAPRSRRPGGGGWRRSRRAASGESPKPGRSTAITSRSARAGRSPGSQIRREPPRPWIRTRGSPAPRRS